MTTEQSKTRPAELPIIDAHINVASTRFIPRQFIEDKAANVFSRFEQTGEHLPRSRVYDRVFALYNDHNADNLVHEMDAAGISSAVLLAPDFSHVCKCELTPDEVMAEHFALTRRHPGRFHVFAGVDPRSGIEGVDRFERGVREQDVRGLKLYPPCGYSPSDSRLFPYFEICAARGLPVLLHTGPGWQALDFQYGSPLLVDEAARAFPQVNFVLGHGAVTYVEECSYLCMYRSNVFMDLSGVTSVASPDGWPAHINRVFRTGINHKIVFGSSWPAFKLSTSLQKVVSEFRSGGAAIAGIKSREIRWILSSNIARLLAPRQEIPEGAVT